MASDFGTIINHHSGWASLSPAATVSTTPSAIALSQLAVAATSNSAKASAPRSSTGVVLGLTLALAEGLGDATGPEAHPVKTKAPTIAAPAAAEKIDNFIPSILAGKVARRAGKLVG